MAGQQGRLLAPHSRYHDGEQRQELMQESQIQTRLDRYGWSGWGRSTALQSRDSRRSQKQASVCIECGRACGMNDDLRHRIAARHVDDSLAMLTLETTILAQQLPTD